MLLISGVDHLYKSVKAVSIYIMFIYDNSLWDKCIHTGPDKDSVAEICSPG
jgi:hypothetical protein